MWPWRSKEGSSGGSSKPAPPTDQAEAASPPSTPPPSTSSSVASSPSPPPPSSTPSARLAAAWRAATARVSPGDPIPPRPPQLGEWAANTVLCAGAGAAFCGWREAAAEAATTAGATAGATAAAAPPGSTGKAAAAAVARAIAEEKTRKLVRIGSEAIRGAGRFGSLAALFWALQLGSGVARGEPALVADSALAAAATGAVFGLGAVPRGSSAPSARLRSSLLGAALGAGVAVPAAAAQKVLLGLLPEEKKNGKNRSGGEGSGGATTNWERTEAAASPFSSPNSSSSTPPSSSSSSSSSSAEAILAVAEHLESSLTTRKSK